MKSYKILFTAALIAFLPCALGAQSGGYTGPKSEISTVKQAKSLRDDTPVILRGKIIKYLGDENYLFEDSTDTIVVEIDNKVWGTTAVSEKDLVEISGEVDNSFITTEIDVSSVKKL